MNEGKARIPGGLDMDFNMRNGASEGNVAMTERVRTNGVVLALRLCMLDSIVDVCSRCFP